MFKPVSYNFGDDILYIREVTSSDADDLIRFLEAVVCETDFLLTGPEDKPITLEEEIKFINSYYSNTNSLLLCGLWNGEISAVADIKAFSFSRRAHVAEMGISVLKKNWRKRIGFSMMQEVINWAQANTRLSKLSLRVHEQNLGAIALYKKLGFKIEGTLENDLHINNQYFSTVLMGRTL
ncbi:GNAT family N-acetyltransferase [Myxococcota bacterium]|nr:GNAT family N-acetyltransferase [Myxococcota bacterium]MBU1381971.1 GNAT family N-acetyltransferase [Myxococcota bacterium]MBU1495403.1 GNAT family N-acetyltransferase [Myxococcota bacterium]